MKIILTLLSVFFFTACRNVESKQAIEISNIDTLTTKKTRINPQFDGNIISEIKKHYQNKYGKKGEFEEQITDSTYEISYRHLPKMDEEENEEDDYFSIMIYIAKKNNDKKLFSTNPIIYGDLNNDKYRDLVVTTHLEGGGNANWWNEMFVFLNENDKLIFTSVTNAVEISDCEGVFSPKKIENNYLIGNSFCFGPDDTVWNPSVQYSTKVKLSNNKLVFNSKTKME